MTTSKEISVGIRIDKEKGVVLFGAEDVNRLLAEGWRVVRLQGGGAVFAKTGENETTVRMVIAGCDMKVFMERVETYDP